MGIGLSSFTPAAGQSFDILDGTLSGTFSSVSLPSLPSGLMWNTSKLYTTGVLSVQIVGDYNGDGVMNAADFVVWRKSLTQTGTGLAADGNHNNSIDAGDYTVWRAHFGQIAGSGAGVGLSGAIPEPAGATMLLVGLLAASARSHSRSGTHRLKPQPRDRNFL